MSNDQSPPTDRRRACGHHGVAPGFDRLGKEEEAQALVGAIGLCLGADALAGLMSRLLRDAP